MKILLSILIVFTIIALILWMGIVIGNALFYISELIRKYKQNKKERLDLKVSSSTSSLNLATKVMKCTDLKRETKEESELQEKIQRQKEAVLADGLQEKIRRQKEAVLAYRTNKIPVEKDNDEK